MDIYRLNALSDNYIFVLHDRNYNTAAVVDPAEATPVLQKLEELGAPLGTIFNTHHHADHVGGNRQLLAHYPEAVVYGGAEDCDRIPGQQIFLQEGDTVTFAGRTGTVLFVPGHTRAHIAYYFSPAPGSDWGDLFCGDTLFAGGCGRLFEGTPEQMVQSLSKIRTLPDQTRIWCAHEYTLKNLKFALTVDGQNPDLQQRFAMVKAARQRQQATIPSDLGLEKATNPFLRWDHLALQKAVQSHEPVQAFARLRSRKDQF
ncbi:Hydroxyacylglutathione hydrolase [Halomicronema hongdechloris C2206]|uniref:Hydroxyacylglutathione hydrolase n=1 Tax=Halomicronema hongdechloris C2206 TaxID=1641165 RepID=A0A1Z3HSJ2_9CYAN|nr:hydroxyacylglutathione hydrolase [Halomicronema hongdechloris]ASC73265.1 Hydroxyacylglutathione hydrolase [Halomicronema hongdechloris C2206]